MIGRLNARILRFLAGSLDMRLQFVIAANDAGGIFRMKTMIGVCLIGCILFSGNSVVGAELTAADFSLEVNCPKVSSTRRFLPLDLEVTYTGKEPREVLALKDDFIDISFDTPQGWMGGTRPSKKVLTGRLPIVTMKQWDSISRTINLHDYFAKITPGKATFGLTLRIWPKAGRSKEPVVLRERVTLTVVNESDDDLKSYIKKTANRISGENNVEKKRKLYHDIMGVSRPGKASAVVMAILTKGLTDMQVQGIHGQMRKKLFDVAESQGHRRILVRYLAERGARYDHYFFSMWQHKKVSLSDEALSLLQKARNPWIRLYALKASPKTTGIRGDIGSLQAEIEDMTAYLEEVKKANSQ
jgi:hypothetical protein